MYISVLAGDVSNNGDDVCRSIGCRFGVFISHLGISNCDSVSVSVSSPGRWRIGGKGDGGTEM